MSSAESGGCGGGRGEEGRGGKGRVTHAGELQQLTLQRVAIAEKPQPPFCRTSSFLPARVWRAADAPRVCLMMAFAFYLIGNFFLIAVFH